MMRFLIHQTINTETVRGPTTDRVDFHFIVLLRSGGSNVICQVNSKPPAQLRQF